MATDKQDSKSITGNFQGYSGGTGSKSTGTKSDSSSKRDNTTIDLNSFLSDSSLEEYTAPTADIQPTDDTSEPFIVTDTDIMSLVGTMSQADYADFLEGITDYYEEQFNYYDKLLNGEGGLYDIRAHYSMFNVDNIKYAVFMQDEFIREQVELKLQWYGPGLNLDHMGVTQEEWDAAENKQQFIMEHDPDIVALLAENETHLENYIIENYSEYGLSTYEEWVQFRDNNEALISQAEEMRKSARCLKASAKYDYLPFLEDYANYTPPETDYFQLYAASGTDMDYSTFKKIIDYNPQIAKTYYYLLEKDPSSASQYFKDIKFELNNFQGQAEAAAFLSLLGHADGSWDVVDAIWNELGVNLEGTADGLDTFFSGLGYAAEAILTLIGLTEENRITSASEFKKLYILQALLPTETKIQMGLIYRDDKGVLHNTDPNSMIDYTIEYSGPFLNNNYEISQGLGNMLPSIIISLYCPTAGQWLMGTSAGGNAYHSAMVEGHDLLTSFFYGLFTGASEAISEKLLGGLIGLSDIQITSLLSYFKSMGREAFQEVFQLVMDKIYRCVAMGEKLPSTVEEWEEFGREALKSGGYGAITAGILNSPALIAAIKHNRAAKNGIALVPGLEVEGTDTQTEVETGSGTDVQTEVESNTDAPEIKVETEEYAPGETDTSNPDVKTDVDTTTPKTHLTEAEALAIAQDILDPYSTTSFADCVGLDAESVQMITEAMMPDELVSGLKALPTDAKMDVFGKLSPEGKVAAFDALTSTEKYNHYLATTGGDWAKTHLHGLTAENASQYVTITPSGELDLDWPKIGGYKPGTIQSLDSLSGEVVVSRVGSKGGDCWGLHLDIDPADIDTPGADAKIADVTMSERGILQGDSVLTGDEQAYKGVLNVDKYNDTVHTLAQVGSGVDPMTIESELMDMGYTQTQAKNLMEQYAATISRSEWSEAGNIYEGRGQQGDGGAITGAYGTTEAWQGLSGGATQMTTQLPPWVLIDCGILTNVTDGIMINP